MSEECTHNCDSCGENCESRSGIQKLKPNELSNISKHIAIVSGKGGVGKSLVTALLAVSASRRGLRTAIADCDITGPSIPRMFGLTERAGFTDEGLLPGITSSGIEVMSINLLLKEDTDPVVWRGPIIASTVRQFYTDVLWNDVDLMFFDMPPGTGDVPLTVFQQIPLDGIIIVTSPQELVSMIVSKAVRMAELMDIPVLGIVENMSYAVCPDCGKHFSLFGESKTDEIAAKHELKVLARLPIDPKLAAAADTGAVELSDCPAVEPVLDAIEGI